MMSSEGEDDEEVRVEVDASEEEDEEVGRGKPNLSSDGESASDAEESGDAGRSALRILADASLTPSSERQTSESAEQEQPSEDADVEDADVAWDANMSLEQQLKLGWFSHQSGRARSRIVHPAFQEAVPDTSLDEAEIYTLVHRQAP